MSDTEADRRHGRPGGRPGAKPAGATGADAPKASAPAPVRAFTTRHPRVALNPGAERRLQGGHPWAYSNEVQMTAEAKALPQGSLVCLVSARGDALGTAMFNPHTLIAARRLSHDPDAAIDQAFFEAKLAEAAALRRRLVPVPYARIIHAEADGLPGLVLDRFGDLVVAQVNTAGLERATPVLLAAIERVLAPTAILLRNDTGARAIEGLAAATVVAKGPVPERIDVVEGSLRLLAEPEGGQKTGWFYDQRTNRGLVAGFCAGARVLDLFAHTGGFGLQAAAAGAERVSLIDSSARALMLAERAAARAGLTERVETHKADVFAALEHLQRTGDLFDVVIADPPAYAKSRKDVPVALKGYRKLARLSAGAVAPAGLLFIASCSHAIDRANFAAQVARGVADAGRSARILAETGAAPDHPVHPHLPETAYLKGMLLAID